MDSNCEPKKYISVRKRIQVALRRTLSQGRGGTASKADATLVVLHWPAALYESLPCLKQNRHYNDKTYCTIRVLLYLSARLSLSALTCVSVGNIIKRDPSPFCIGRTVHFRGAEALGVCFSAPEPSTDTHGRGIDTMSNVTQTHA